MSTLSVVDYTAWNRGYMPPSEHILIHKLSHEGARVAFASWLGGDAHMWIVLEGGKALTNKQRKAMREFVLLMVDDEPEEQTTKLTEPGTSEVTE